MQYEFSIPSGQQVEVRLYFYDGFDGTSNVGDRVFDVSVEEQTIDNFDIIETFGDQTAGMKSFTVVSDGTIDIDFAHETENPEIRAIEIVSAEAQPDTLDGPNNVDFGTVVIGNNQTKQVTVTNLGNASNTSHPDITITDVSLSGASTSAFSTNFSGGQTLAPGDSVDIPVVFEPSDAQAKSATLAISHSGDNTPLTVDFSGEGASDVPVGFGVSGLNVNLGNPTSLDFGPDGRLYVAQQNGEIKAFNITRNGPNDYEVIDTEIISAVQNIPNHDDDGSYNSNVNNRQVTGLTVEGTPSTPIIYVTSSDPRIGAGGSHTDSGLDTNSGVISRLTQQSDGTWNHDMLVRGLPRSEENHATNGIQYDGEDNILYVAQGGHTNKGAPSDNFALTPEYALSAAILEIDLDQINAMPEKDAANTEATYLYDLPTLNPSATQTDGPFGGMDGANMANWTSNSPVDVYAPGFRNPYDIALNSNGQLYATDNSANTGWGGIVVNEGPQGECTNEQNEQDESSPPGVYHIDGEDYYGGHPNPTRGNDTSDFAAAVKDDLHDPINCNYISPTNMSSPSAALETYGPTPQGMDVYTASNFGEAMKGDLLLAMWNSGDVERVELNAAGTEAISSETIFQNIGNNPLDVHAQSDQGPFPGTVWAATYGSNDITIFEPNDYEGIETPTCTADDPSAPGYTPDGDADNDGYTNTDENTVGTDPCSQASQPADRDQDGIPDSLDDDDDNDGIPDSKDPFAIDPQNGLDTTVPVDRQFEAGQSPQSLFGLGFTGLMTNGTDYADLYNGSEVRAGGATEKFSVDEVPFGDAFEGKNSQSYAFQYGVDTPNEPFVIRTTVVAPFSDDMTPENYQSAGIQIGTGDQDNYIKLVATAQDANGNPNGGVEFLLEEAGSVDNSQQTVLSEPTVFGSGQIIDLFLTVDPTTDPTPTDGSADVAVTAAYSINGGQTVEFSQTLPAPENWFTNNSQGTAVGLISTANGASSTFSASWDRLTVKTVGSNTAPTADAGSDQTITEGDTVTLDASASSDLNADDTLSYTWTQTDGPSVTLSDASAVQPTFTAPAVTENTTLTFEVEVDDGIATDIDTVTVTVQNNDTVTGDVVYRINTGGDAYTDVDGNQWAADNYFNTVGQTTDAETNFGTTDIDGTDDDRLYLTERYWQNPSGIEYSLPVENGTYTVRLHLAEIYFGSQTNTGDGERVMSANIEGGQVELDSYDIHADVGPNTATVKEYTIEVTDGSLDIDFSASANNPKIAAIEVFGTGEAATEGEATIAIDEDEGIGATTWDSESFEIQNTGDEPIEEITLDLSTAVLPDVVFDPQGTAGDQGAKGFVLNNNGTSGTVVATVTNPHNGVDGSDGYDTLVIDFGSFQPGESITFEMDNDPTSIKGGSGVQSGEAGPISGLELSGSTMTAEFGDGTTAKTSLFSDGSKGGSQGTADEIVAPAPTISAQGVSLSTTTLSPDHTAATVASPSQTIMVDGQPGETVTLLRIEGELNLDGVPTYDGTPGYEIENYEANTAIQVEEYTATIGSDGSASIPVTLTNSSASGGLNYFIASAEDGEDETGSTSNVVIIELDTSKTGEMTVAEVVASQNGPENKIGLDDIQTAINWWATGTEVPNTGGETISLTQMQQLINTWATGATVGG